MAMRRDVSFFNGVTKAEDFVLSKAAGSMQFLDDGAWTKRTHPGWASVCAQTAVVMAKHGFFGPRAPFFGRFGLFSTHTQEGSAINVCKLTDRLGEQWEMLNIAFKPYPACHMTHAFADATIHLKREHMLVSKDINRVVVNRVLHVHQADHVECPRQVVGVLAQRRQGRIGDVVRR